MDMGGKGSRQSVPRTVADSGIYYKNAAEKYVGLHLMPLVYGNVATIASYNLFDLAGISPEEVAEFCRLRKRVDFSPVYEGGETHFKDVVAPKGNCFENIEGQAYVMPLRLKSKSKGPHLLTVTNWESYDSPEEYKVDSIKHITISCDCPRSKMVRICRAPIEQRLEHGDTRTYKDNPGPFIETDVCPHSVVGLNWLSMFYGVEGLNVFGLPQKSMDVTRRVVHDVLTHGTTMYKRKDYELNQYYEKFYNLQKELFGHLVVLAKMP